MLEVSDTDLRRTISRRIMEASQQRGMKHPYLKRRAEQLGICSSSALSNYLNGSRVPTVHILNRLAHEVLYVRPGWILDDGGEMELEIQPELPDDAAALGLELFEPSVKRRIARLADGLTRAHILWRVAEKKPSTKPLPEQLRHIGEPYRTLAAFLRLPWTLPYLGADDQPNPGNRLHQDICHGFLDVLERFDVVGKSALDSAAAENLRALVFPRDPDSPEELLRHERERRKARNREVISARVITVPSGVAKRGKRVPAEAREVRKLRHNLELLSEKGIWPTLDNADRPVIQLTIHDKRVGGEWKTLDDVVAWALEHGDELLSALRALASVSTKSPAEKTDVDRGEHP